MLPARSSHIDALRGFAILFVIQFHLFSTTGAYEFLGLPTVLQRLLDYGWAGVDLFFVLSAYLLTRNMMKQDDEPGVIGRFYVRRALRILPLYFCVLALGFTLEGILDPQRSTWLWAGRYDLQAYLLFVQNWLHGADGHPGGQFYGPTWSLAVEEHFYIVLPILVLTLSRRGLLLIAASWILVSPLLRLAVETNVNPIAAYTWTVTRLDSFGWGILVAGLQPKLAIWLAGRERALIFVAAALFSIVAITMPVVRPGEINGLVAITAIALCAASVSLACVTARGGVPAGFPLGQIYRGLRWAGQRCFSLYLLHMPVLGLVFLAVGLRQPYAGSAAGLTLIGASLLLTLLVSAVTFDFIEAPFMRLAERLTARDRVPPSAEPEHA